MAPDIGSFLAGGRVEDYTNRHCGEWQELEGLVRRARRSVKRLSPEELSRLDVLYRKAAIQLAQASTRVHDAGLLRYLNDLTAAAHAIIYLPPRRLRPGTALAFVTEGFARSIARTYVYHALAAALLMLGALGAYVAVQSDPAAAYALLPPGEFRQPGMSSDQLASILQHGRGQGGGTKFLFASFLFSHNLKVGFLSLATGVLAAIPTVLLMIYNGCVLGALTSVYHGAGICSEYWAWILPHGATELTAIVFCGGIGFMLGRAVVAPGIKTREQALLEAGREAARILVGVAGMLVFAALVESYLRQSNLSTGARLLFAAATFAFWAAYFVHGALREKASRRELGKSREGRPAVT